MKLGTFNEYLTWFAYELATIPEDTFNKITNDEWEAVLETGKMIAQAYAIIERVKLKSNGLGLVAMTILNGQLIEKREQQIDHNVESLTKWFELVKSGSY